MRLPRLHQTRLTRRAVKRFGALLSRVARLGALVIVVGWVGLALGQGGCAAAQPPSPSASPATATPATSSPKPTASATAAKPRRSASPRASAPSASGTVSRRGVRATVTFIDVGQGDSILLQVGSFTALVDGGDVAAGGHVAAVLRARGVRRIDELVVTHPHADHIGGLPTVIAAFPVRQAIIDEAGTSATYRGLIAALRQRGTPIVRRYAGAVLRFGAARVLVLHPSPSLTGDYNTDSIVLVISVDGRSIMLTGDVTGTGESDVTARYRGPPLYVLKVAHHGSATSTSAAFLARVHPRFAVIEVGPNSYGHPAASTLRRLRASGATIYTTWKNGDISLSIAPSGAARWSFSRSSRAVTASAINSTRTTAAATAAGAVTGTAADPIVYITRTGSKYHRAGCRYLSHSAIPIRLSVAKARGYTPCSVCDPPR